MTKHKFITANIDTHKAELFELNVEYISWAYERMATLNGVNTVKILGMEAPEYVKSCLDKLCTQSPPQGIIYLVTFNGEYAGMGTLRGLRDDLAELKRIYVRPKFRGVNLGKLLLERLVSDAKNFGYKKIYLESGKFMNSALSLYQTAGFVFRPPYAEAELPDEYLPHWCFMELILNDGN